MKIAICYLTNDKKNQYIPYIIYNQLIYNVINNKKNINKYDIYTLLNTDNLNDDKYVKNTYFFTWKELREKYNHVNRVFYKDYMGVCHLPLFYLQEKQPDYDYYIFYEDDLYFTGFNNNINPFEQPQIYDNDITFLYGRKYNPNWYWVNKFDNNLPNGWLGYEGLLNCYIISNQALKDLKEFCCDGRWYGHHELMVNSFFKNQKNKYKITSLNKIYKSNIFLYEKDLLIYLKNKNIDIKNSFVHPIKSLSIFNMVYHKL